MKLTFPIHPGRLAAAALLAATAALGGSAVADPATACAAPGEWDIGAHDACMEKGGHPMDCCINSGGEWRGTDSTISTDGYCVAPPLEEPADAQPAPPNVVSRPGVTPPTDAATETPPTPRLPVVQQPSGNATVTPQPAAPPTTSTTLPPPR